MKNRFISRACSMLLTAAMLMTSTPASVLAESIEESVFTDVETENDFADPYVEDAQQSEEAAVEDVEEEQAFELADPDQQLADFSDGNQEQGSSSGQEGSQVPADQVASVYVDMLNARTEFYEGLTDGYKIIGAVLHITYGDGSTTELTYDGFSTSVEDNEHGYEWLYEYEKVDGTGDGTEAGTYNLEITGYDIRGKGRPEVEVTEGIRQLTVKPRSETPKLTVGDENYNIVSATDGGDSWYQLTVQQSGVYVFKPVGMNVLVIEEDGDTLLGVERLFSETDSVTKVAYPLTAGKTYYVNFKDPVYISTDEGYSETDQIEQMSIYKIPGISSVEVNADNVQKEYVENQDDISFKGAKVTIHYDDGTSYDIEYYGGSGRDQYGNVFSEYIKKDDQTWSAWEMLESGDYKMYFTCNRQIIGNQDGYDIKVVQLKDVRTLQPGLNADIEGYAETNRWYQFTPTEDGQYTMYPMSNMSWLYPEKEDASHFLDNDALNYISSEITKDAGLKLSYELKAGTTYYLRFSDALCVGTDEEYANKADLHIVQTPHVQSVSTNLVRTEFTEGWSSTWQPGGFLHLTFSGGATQDVQFKEGVKDSYGNTYRQYYRDASGTEHPLGNFLSAGTYQLVIKCNEKPVPMDKEYTIHVSALDELTELHEGVNKEVKYNKTSGNNQECV